MDWPGDDKPDPTVNDKPLEPEDESDTEDFKHDGNGTPCKFYNGPNGCDRGKHCQFRHAPDSRSVRDELYVPRFPPHSLRLPLTLLNVTEAGTYASTGS